MTAARLAVTLGFELALVAAVACGAPSQPALRTVTIEFWGPASAQPGPDGRSHGYARPTMAHIDYPSAVTLKVINHDTVRHSIRIPKLSVDVVAEPAADGTPSIAFFSLPPMGPGTYRWYCYLPCDDAGDGWAMRDGPSGPARDDYMAGYLHVA